MNRATFFKQFDLLADQPDAVVKMRELILQLAIQGRLLACDAKDKSAAALAARVRAAKESDFAPISNDEVPFTLPASWEWLRIGEAMNLFNGRAFKPSDWSQEGLPIIRIQNLNKPEAPFNYCNFEVDEKVIVRDDDLLISWSGTPGTSFGAFIWNRGRAVLNQHIFRVAPLGNAYTKEFLRLAVNGRLEEMIAKAHGAVGLQHITKGKLEMLVLPLPPLAEQRRIVAKVDELMALCDELGTRQQARHDARAHLQQSALHHLLAAREPQTFAAAWPRVRDQFHLLHDTPDALPQLRQTILQLAVQGRLVPQNPKDEPADVLVRKLSEVKNNNLNGRKVKEEVDASDDEMQFDVPTGWQIAKLGEIADIGTGSTPTSTNPAYYEHGTIPWITSSATSQPFIDSAETLVTEKAVADFRLKLYESGTIIIAMYGQGKTRGQVSRLQIKATVNQACATIGLPDGYDSVSDYIVLVLREQYLKIREQSAGGAQPNLNGSKIKSIPLLLPPLAEQKRIVARVAELLRQCDALEAQLRQTRTLGAHLLDSTLHHLLAA